MNLCKLLFTNYKLPTRQLLSNISVRLCATQALTNASNQIKPKEDDGQLDKLYKLVEIELRGHEPAVMKSYRMFVTMAAKELGIKVGKSWEPFRHIQRRTLLRSAFVKKKYRVQYEWRTYFRIMHFHHLTGSTNDTFLEYIQRNLPEGIAMKVNKTALERLPDHIVPPDDVKLNQEQVE